MAKKIEVFEKFRIWVKLCSFKRLTVQKKLHLENLSEVEYEKNCEEFRKYGGDLLVFSDTNLELKKNSC